MQPIEYDDKELLRRLKTDDEVAFRQLYDRYWRPLYAVAYNRLRDASIVEDLIQDLFIDVWVKRRTLLIQQSLRAYLYAAVKNRVLDQIRKSITRENFVQHILATATDLDDTTSHGLACNELDTALKQQVRQLPDQRRLIFELSRYEQLSHAEIAQRLNISPKTVENQLSRALKTLRRGLRELLMLALLGWLGR